MFTDIAHALARILAFLVRAPIGLGGSPRTVSTAVTVRLTDNDNKPLPGIRLRLFAGRGDQAAPDAGTVFVTEASGEASFTTQAVFDRKWFWVNVGFTGLAAPHRMDHLVVAVELGHIVPGSGARFPLLYTLDISRAKGGDCWSLGFYRIYAADPAGRFTRAITKRHPGIAMPGGGTLAFGGNAYRVTDFAITPSETGDWHLDLAIARERSA
jgi:hypothetical protein